jgi:hypothetical protein
MEIDNTRVVRPLLTPHTHIFMYVPNASGSTTPHTNAQIDPYCKGVTGCSMIARLISLDKRWVPMSTVAKHCSTGRIFKKRNIYWITVSRTQFDLVEQQLLASAEVRRE